MADQSVSQNVSTDLDDPVPGNDEAVAEASIDAVPAARAIGAEQGNPALGPSTAQTAPSAPEAEWVAEIRKLNWRFTEQEHLSTVREAIITRLNDENQRLKAGELLKQMMPIYRDLMRLYDDLTRTAAEYRAKDSIDVAKAAGDWEFFSTLVTDLLYRYGVEVIPVEPGTAFEARLHRAAAAQKTPLPERDRTVSRVISAGFTTDSRVMRPAAVEVLRFEAP